MTGKTADQTVASLDRDTANANQSIGKIFDAQKVADQQAERQLAAQTIQQAMPLLDGGGANGAAAAGATGLADAYNRQLHKDTKPAKDEEKESE